MKRWYGQFFGFIAGWFLLRHPVGAFLGLLVGYAFDHDWFSSPKKQRAEDQADEDTEHSASFDDDADIDWAYRVLGVRPNANRVEIERVYRKLMGQYHPDRVTGAAPEIQRLAEKKAREINAAYDRIQKLRRK